MFSPTLPVATLKPARDRREVVKADCIHDVILDACTPHSLATPSTGAVALIGIPAC